MQLATSMVQLPEVFVINHPTKSKKGFFSDDDSRKIIEFILKYPKTCFINSTDEDFVNAVSDTVLHIQDDGGVELFLGSYSSAMNALQERKDLTGENVTYSDVGFALFLIMLLCPFEALFIFYYY